MTAALNGKDSVPRVRRLCEQRVMFLNQTGRGSVCADGPHVAVSLTEGLIWITQLCVSAG